MRIFQILIFCLLSVTVLAQQSSSNRADLEKRRESILQSIRETQEQLEQTKQNKKVSLAQLRALQSKLAERQKLIGNINQEISAINKNIQYSSKEIGQLRQNLDMLKVRYAQSIRYAYKNRTSYNMIAFLFSSTDFNEAIRRLKYLKKYRDYRKEQADQIRLTQSKIEKKLGILNSEKSQKDVLKLAQEQQKMEVEKEANETDKVVKELKGREKELAGSIAKNQKSLKQLERTIQNLIQREIELARKREEEERRREEQKKKEEEQRRLAAANSSSTNMNVATGSGTRNVGGNVATNNPKPSTGTTSSKPSAPAEPSRPVASNTARPSYSLSLTPEVAELSNNFESNRGRLPWPVEKGFIAEHFGINKHPVYNIETENSGVEIQTSPNAPARAVFSGVVKNVFYVPGMGQCVLVDHGRFFTVYSRLANVSVSKGQTVAMKQTIGNVMANENGSYLMHFELWKVGANDKTAAQNPEGWIAK